MLVIRIEIGDTVLHGALDDTEAGRMIARALPVTTDFAVWGDALHFVAPVAEDPVMRPNPRVRVGDLVLVLGCSTICVFFGPTPLSPAEDPVAVSPVVVAGSVTGAERLRPCKEASTITLSPAADPEAART